MSKLYVNYPFNFWQFSARIAAKMNGKALDVEVVSEETKNSKEFKAINITGKYPFLTTPEGNLCESLAIAKYLAHGHATLLGSNAVERAKIDQWCLWSVTTQVPESMNAIHAIHGWGEITQNDYTVSANAIKANAKNLNVALQGKNWLVGDNCTLADIVVATHFIIAQQTILDGGFRKAMGNFAAWFERVAALPDFVAVCGNIKVAQKAVKPQIKAEVKEAPKAVAKPAAKPKANDDDDDNQYQDKKVKSALELLPPTTFDLFNFKTFMVNVKDKKGEGIDELKKQMDQAGFSIWFLHYEMYKGEGIELYKTENMCKGFLQRFDDFRKYCLARHLVLGTEQKQEIMGVWLWRGVGIPQEAKDHPQFEYYKTRQMDIFNNPEDDKLIRQFWGAEYEDTIMDMGVLSINWHK
jgi:elongation factor 1-gamma